MNGVPILVTQASNNKSRFEWRVPIPAKLCSLVGHKTYKNKSTARRAAKIALARLFGGYGDMV